MQSLFPFPASLPECPGELAHRLTRNQKVIGSNPVERTQIDLTEKMGFVQSIEFLKNVLKFAQQFSRPEKVWKMEIKSGKMAKRLDFFQSYMYNKCLICDFFFHFSQILFNLHLCSLFFSVLTYLITLSMEKEIVVLEKSLEKVLNFGFKNLYERCKKQLSHNIILFCCFYLSR